MTALEHHSKFLSVLFSNYDVTSGAKHLTELVKASCENAMCKDKEVDDIISCAADLINLFVQLNWTGPPVSLDEQLERLIGGGQGTCVLPKLNKESLDRLSWDGEPVYPLVQCPLLLYLAYLLLEGCGSHLHGNRTPLSLKLHHWRLRCLCLQQRLLSQRSASLWEELNKVIESVETDMATVQLARVDKCELSLELGHSFLHYSMFEKAKENFTKAKEHAKLTFELTGALGKRTKFQGEDTAQLLLQVTSELPQDDGGETTPVTSSLPKNLLMRDDTLLEHVEFAEPQSTDILTPPQQAVLIGHCMYMQRCNPAHRLNLEEYEAYINCILASPQCWAVECTALYLRCMLEKKRHRTVERAMSQLEELVDCHSRPTPKPSERLSLAYCISFPPLWTIQRELADTLVSLGCLQSALELYERLEMWQEMAECLQAAGRTGRAEEVLRQQLAHNETPTLCCLLGDVTKDPSCYIRAWELSNHHSARAQRSLGLHHLHQEHYEESIGCFQLSLKVNSMQEKLWFSLGFAADRIGRNELAIKSYHRCVNLDPDFGEAWNNLANAYLKANDKVRAFRVFKEAVKCSYDNWKIWENLLVVGADIGVFDDAICAYHRLLDLRDKFTDSEVLGVLVRSVVGGALDINNSPASRCRRPLGELLGRVTSQTTASADVWRLYAEFHLTSEDSSDHDKALVELQKAQRMSKMEPGWDREVEKLRRVVSFTLDYCQTCRRICESRDLSRQKDSLHSLSSAKLALQGVLSKASNFGLTSCPEVDLFVSEMKEEKELLLAAITGLVPTHDTN